MEKIELAVTAKSSFEYRVQKNTFHFLGLSQF